jgi:hypothetical protein
MANFEIDEDQAALIRELRKLETSDPVHANVYNALFEKLINNDAFLERLANKMVEKSMLCHVLDSVNAQQVLAADVGPKITAITNELKENVSVLNTKIADTSGIANTANAKIELDGPIKVIAYGSDKNKWAFQLQFPDGVILSLGISETEIFYDYYDGAKWVRKWTR